MIRRSLARELAGLQITDRGRAVLDTCTAYAFLTLLVVALAVTGTATGPF